MGLKHHQMLGSKLLGLMNIERGRPAEREKSSDTMKSADTMHAPKQGDCRCFAASTPDGEIHEFIPPHNKQSWQYSCREDARLWGHTGLTKTLFSF
jgi:hypothetical protein